MNVEPTVGLALLAGLVSFISPCVLPLVPAYIGYMSGHATTAAGESGRGKFSTFLHGLFFVLGFTIFFVGFGLLTAAASDWLTQRGIDIPTIITRLGGVAVILFGLYVMKALDPVFRRGQSFARQMKENTGLAVGFTLIVVVVLLAYYYWVFESLIGAAAFFLLTIGLFYKPISRAKNLSDMWLNIISSLQTALISDTRKLDMPRRNTGYLGSTGMGIVFAAGWTPCIGPIYGSVLTLATDAAVEGESLVRPGILLAAYSLGLGVPFLITALALNQTTGLMKSLKRNMRKVEYVSGTLLILIGVLILSGSLEEITRRFGSDGSLGELSVRLETCSVGAAEGRIQLSSWRSCLSDGNPKLSDRIIFASKRPAATELTALDTSQIQDFGALDTVEVGL
ncbi:MAG: cytochrome c biogenesis protein CcdA, partial [Anaerolineae bacterium]|nr:cytochrome c biogenesis protein CcdA [Anaerolineae bacterium]